MSSSLAQRCASSALSLSGSVMDAVGGGVTVTISASERYFRQQHHQNSERKYRNGNRRHGGNLHRDSGAVGHERIPLCHKARKKDTARFSGLQFRLGHGYKNARRCRAILQGFERALFNQRQAAIKLNQVACQVLNHHRVHQMIL